MPDKPINRIPNLPIGQLVDESGNPTPEELLFRQTLVSSLQQHIGSEGLVAPSQTNADITAIVANVKENPGTTDSYTCAPGTFFYDSTELNPDLSVKVVVLTAGVPTIRTVQLV